MAGTDEGLPGSVTSVTDSVIPETARIYCCRIESAMGFRFQRRIRIAPGVRLNLSKSGIGGSLGRTGLRLGVDAKRRKYVSVGLLGTGLSYRTFFGERVKPETVKMIAYIVVGVALCLAILVLVTMHTG